MSPLLRAMLRRCPRCASKVVRGLWRVPKHCPSCSLVIEPEEGAFLGSLALNYGVTGVAFIATLTIWLAIDLPSVHAAALVVTMLAVSTAVPLLFFGHAKMLWVAIDLLLHSDRPRTS